MKSWDAIAARTGDTHTAEEFEQVAYRLLCEQVLYHADKQSRAAYWLVDSFERDFKEVLDLVGVDIGVNRQLKYVFAIPRYGSSTPASTTHTLLALVLRRIYDDVAQQGGMTDTGEVIIDDVELGEKHRLLTDRDLPSKGELDAALRTLRRWGIARRHQEDVVQGFSIAIRPAIVDVLGESTLARLLRYADTGRPPAETDAPDSVATDNDPSRDGDEELFDEA